MWGKVGGPGNLIMIIIIIITIIIIISSIIIILILMMLILIMTVTWMNDHWRDQGRVLCHNQKARAQEVRALHGARCKF